MRLECGFHSAWKDLSTVIARAVSIISLGTFPWGTSYTPTNLPPPPPPSPHALSLKAPTRKGWQSCDLTKALDCRNATAIPACPCQLTVSPSTRNQAGVEKRSEEEKCPVRALLHSRGHPNIPAWPHSPLLSAIATEIPFYRGHDAVWRKS